MRNRVTLETHGVEVRIDPEEGVAVVSYEGRDLAAIFIHDLRGGTEFLGTPKLDTNEFLIATWTRSEFRRLHQAKVMDTDG